MEHAATLRNAVADTYETHIGASAVFKLFGGTKPAFAAADAAELLVTIQLPADWLADSVDGLKAKAGTWSAAATASGTPTHYRLYKSDGTTLMEQGTAGTIGTDAIVNSATITAGQTVSITQFNKTFGSARSV